HQSFEVGEVRLDRRVGMMVGKSPVDLAEDHMMMARQPLDDHVEDRPRGAVAGVPTNAERIAREAFEEAICISLANVDFLDRAAAFAPVTRRRALADLLDLGAEHRAALQ